MAKSKTARYEDIIQTIPEYDDDDESWYLTHLWMYCYPRRVTYTTCDSDGNHEPCSKKEADEIIESADRRWLEYAKWVIEHNGEDPVHEFVVTARRKFRRNVVLNLVLWIGASTHGLALESVKWAKGRQTPDQLPKGLRDWCGVTKFKGRWVCPDWKTVEQLKEELKDAPDVGYIGNLPNGGVYIKAVAEWSEPREERLVRRDVVRAARRSVKRRETRMIKPKNNNE